MKNKKIFTIGGATFDMFIKAKDHSILKFLEQDSSKEYVCLDYGGKVKIDDVKEAFGGGATNTGIAFARMGYEVCTVVKVGSEYGEKVINNLEAEGVDTQFIKKTNRDKTAFSTILNTFEGDRTVLAYAGANQFLTAKDLPAKELENVDWIFLNHLAKMDSQIPAQLLKILKKNPHIKLAWNPGKEQLMQGVKKWKELLKRTELLFLNKEEAAEFTKTPFRLAGIKQDDPKCHIHLPQSFLPPYANDVSEIMYEFFKHGANNVIITDGRNGSQASDGKRLYFCPVITHKRVDTLGAGDAFASGVTGAVIEGETLKNALKYGTLNAKNVVSYFGAQEGLMTLSELQKELKALDICVTSTKLN